MHEILIGIPYALLSISLFVGILFLAEKYMTVQRFLIILLIIVFLFVAFIFGSIKSAHAATPQEHVITDSKTYCEEMEERIDKADDMEYTELEDLQERFSAECEGN